MTSPKKQVESREIRWNDWSEITELIDVYQPSETVSVIVPAKTTQKTLDLCLAALAAQDYPSNLLEIIVVDHKSETPLRVPDWSDAKIFRLDSGHGPGSARDYGTSFATGNVFLFIDADIISSPDMVSRYARWPSFDKRYVGLGFRDFIDPDKVPGEVLSSGIRNRRLGHVLRSEYFVEGQEWIDSFLRKSHDNVLWRDDLWIVVVGAGVSIHRDFYKWSGGFKDFEVHGVEDTEFGWRVFNSGAVIIPDRTAHGYHLGLRSISRNRSEINSRRRGALANVIPNTRYRPNLPGREWLVPMVSINVVGEQTACFTDYISTINDLLLVADGDVHIHANLGPLNDSDRNVVASNFMGESRVSFENHSKSIGSDLTVHKSSRYYLNVRAGTRFQKATFSRLESALIAGSIGGLSLVSGSDPVSVEFGWTNALSRALYSCLNDDEAREYIENYYGWKWEAFGDFIDPNKPFSSAVRSRGGRYEYEGEI